MLAPLPSDDDVINTFLTAAPAVPAPPAGLPAAAPAVPAAPAASVEPVTEVVDDLALADFLASPPVPEMSLTKLWGILGRSTE